MGLQPTPALLLLQWSLCCSQNTQVQLEKQRLEMLWEKHQKGQLCFSLQTRHLGVKVSEKLHSLVKRLKKRKVANARGKL